MLTTNVGPGSDLELQEIADTMGFAKKVVVITGAGISTNCGIPDFRSENGLYSLIQAQYDAALKNPPWQDKDEYDIDDRPRKKRKGWFYEVVRQDGTVVDVIDPDVITTAENPPSPLLCSTPQPQGPPNHLAESKIPSSPLSSLGSTPSRTPELQSNAPSTASSRSQSPANSQSPGLSSQTSQSGGESSQTTRADLPNLKGRDLFDSMIWKDAFTTSIFYMFITSLREKIQEVQTTSPTHQFIRVLQDGGRLVRTYTQNIDGLEEREGLSTDLGLGPGSRARFMAKSTREPQPERIDIDSNHYGGVRCVQLHGRLDKLRCGICARLSEWDNDRLTTTQAGSAPDCPFCLQYTRERAGRGRRGLAVGRLRPDIVLYGEEHPSANLIGPLITHDLSLAPDVLLIMGTSLKVHGLKVVVKEFANAVHNKGGKVIFVNLTKPPESTWGDVFDYWVEWDCDAWVADLKIRRDDIWLPQGDPRIPKESKSRRESAMTTKAKRDSTETTKVRLSVKQIDGMYEANGKQCNAYLVPYTLKLVKKLAKLTSKKQKSHQAAARNNKAFLETKIRENMCRKLTPSPEVDSNRSEFSTGFESDHTASNVGHATLPPEPLPISIREWTNNLGKNALSSLASGQSSIKEILDNSPHYIKSWIEANPESFRTTLLCLPNLITHKPSGVTSIRVPAGADAQHIHATLNTTQNSNTAPPKLLLPAPRNPSSRPKDNKPGIVIKPGVKNVSKKRPAKSLNESPSATPTRAAPNVVEARKIMPLKKAKRGIDLAAGIPKVQRACDQCRPKKTRCEWTGVACARCIERGLSCEGAVVGFRKESNTASKTSQSLSQIKGNFPAVPATKRPISKVFNVAKAVTQDDSIPRTPVDRKIEHAYGTRASGRFSVGDSTIVVDSPAQPASLASMEDTIVVTTGEANGACGIMRRTPSQRIKDMGSISAILS